MLTINIVLNSTVLIKELGQGRGGGGGQGRTQDLTKGGAHAHAQIIDGCGLSYCTRTRSETHTANTSARYTVGL